MITLGQLKTAIATAEVLEGPVMNNDTPVVIEFEDPLDEFDFSHITHMRSAQLDADGKWGFVLSLREYNGEP